MTTNTQADDAWKSFEENPADETPESDDSTVPIDRYDGEESTEFGDMSVDDLMAQV